MTEYGYSVEVAEGYDEAIVRTRLALRAEGFSIITEMHVGGLLGKGVADDRQYLIMGAWSPDDPRHGDLEGLRLAVHLPCNFVVHETGARAIVATLDPADEVGADAQMSEEAAASVHAALARVLERIDVGA